MFLASGQLQSDLAGTLKTTMDRLGNYWGEFILQAQTWAYQEIVSRLLARGFTPTQINSWDRGAEYERALTLWWALQRGAGLEGYDDKFLKMFDRRAELNTVFVSVGGGWQPPADTPGTVGTGALSTGRDMFVPIDPDDPRIGEPARW
jgi:hypothetical protein